jgi:branched-chain amino acid transport system ATP-binding protein
MLKLELAKAIANEPDLMVVNEPFARISSREVAELSGILKSLRQNGMTLIVVNHHVRGLHQFIDRAFGIQFGSRIADGSPEAITSNPKVQEAYLGGDDP